MYIRKHPNTMAVQTHAYAYAYVVLGVAVCILCVYTIVVVYRKTQKMRTTKTHTVPPLSRGGASKCYSCEAHHRDVGYPSKCLDCESGRASGIDYALGFPPPRATVFSAQ